MSGLCGSSQNTSTSSSGPPAAFQSAYTNLLNQAGGVASQPLQQYTGNVVAGLSPDQQAAIGTIQQSQGVADPYIDAASQLFGQSTTPITTAAPGIAAAAGTQANTAATTGGTGAVTAANNGITAATQGAQTNAATANAAASNDVWSGLPTFQSGINQYMSPYTQQVVDATQAQFNNQNAQTAQGIKGNAISQGAFGGDREGVAQGIAAGQEALAQAPVIANLESQGFQQGTQEFNTQQALQANLGTQKNTLQANTALGAGNLLSSTGINAGQLGSSANLGAGQLGATTALNAGNLGVSAAGQQMSADQANDWLSSQAAAGMASLGNEALNTNLTGASAEMGAGNLEQGIDQEQLNVPYQQFQAQQAYPYQTLNWESGIDTGLGGAAGGTSSTTTPGASLGSQLLGGGLSLASLFAKRGGVIKRASGGGINSAVPDVSITYIPGAGSMTPGRSSAPPPPKGETPDSGIGGIIQSAGGLAQKLLGGGSGSGPGAYLSNDQIANNFSLDGLPDIGSIDLGGAFRRGGGIDVVRRRRADGGATDDNATAPIGPSFTDSIKSPRGIDIPQLSTKKRYQPGIRDAMMRDYGNNPNDAYGKSTLPSSTYYPPVDPWKSEAPTPPPMQTPTIDTGNGPGATDPNAGAGINGGYQLTPAEIDAITQGLQGGWPGAQFRKGGGITGYADGGDVDDDSDDVTIDDDSGDQMADAGGSDPGTGIPTSTPFAAHPIEDQPQGAALPPPPDAGKSGSDSGITAGRYATSYKPREAPPVNTEAEKHDALRTGLLTAGFGIMAGNSPHILQNIGRGGEQGVQAYSATRAAQAARDEKAAEQADTGAYHKGTLDQNAQKFADEVQGKRDTLKQQGEHLVRQDDTNQTKADALKAHYAAMEANAGKPHWTPGGVDKDGNVVLVDANSRGATPTTYTATGMKPKPAAGATTTLNPQTLKDLVIRGVGGENITTYLGNSPANKAAYLNALSDYSANNNIDPKAITAATVQLQADKAGARTLAQMQGRVESSVVEADKFADNALALSQKVNRTKYTPVNAALNAYASNTGDPDIIAFGFANNSLINAYATAVGKGTKTDADTQEAKHLLSIAQSPQQYAAAIRTLKMETRAAQAAPDTVRERMQARITGRNPFAATTSTDAIANPASAQELPVVSGKVDRTKIDPGTLYRTKAGDKLGKDLLEIQ